MLSPRIGVVRKSMLQNPMIMTAPLGRSRVISALPDPNYKFASPPKCKDGGVAQAISWKVSESQQTTEEVEKVDFVDLNRNAVKSGLVTTKEISQYRAQMAVNAPARKKKWEVSRPSLPNIVFGIKSCQKGQSTPMDDVLSYKYYRCWKAEQLNRVHPLPKDKARALRVADNRTSLLRKSGPSLPVKPKLFTLPQFQNVPSALNTFRNPEDRPRGLRTQNPAPSSVMKDTQDSIDLTCELHVSVPIK